MDRQQTFTGVAADDSGDGGRHGHERIVAQRRGCQLLRTASFGGSTAVRLGIAGAGHRAGPVQAAADRLRFFESISLARPTS